jgi:hypothetical protein
LSAEQDGEKSTHIATRLEALAGRFASTDPQPALSGENPPLAWSEQPLFHIIDAGLRGLEHTPN